MRYHRDRLRFGNPRILGENVGDAFWTVFGIAATGGVHDQLVQPFYRPLLPGLAEANNTEGQLIDGAATAATGLGLGFLAGFVNRDAARWIRFGGFSYGVAKMVSAFFPDASLSAKFPNIFGKVAAPRALPSASPALSGYAPGNVGASAMTSGGRRPAGF